VSRRDWLVPELGLLAAPVRAPLAVELGLRGYTAGLEKQRIREMRQALESGSFLWQDLVDYKWQVDDVADDQAIDVLKLYADEGHQGALALLGLLGLIALVSTGNLLAAGGSAETVATKLTEADTAVTVDRGNIGNITTRLLKQSWGRKLLGDAIKRSRSGEPLRWADPTTGELIDPPAEWKGGASFNAMLRYHLKMAGQTVPSGPTQADREEAAFTSFSNAITDAEGALARLLGCAHRDQREADLPRRQGRARQARAHPQALRQDRRCPGR
jgi:hypothetical protein